MGRSNKEARVAAARQLPEDVLMEILSTLRVKDLVRFKSVCKAWNLVISSRDFILLHLMKSRFRAIRLSKLYGPPCKHSLPPGTVISSKHDCLTTEFLGSCDGLVCLYTRAYEIIDIWNPATVSTRRISIKSRPLSQNVRFYWFGHGSEEDDEYKLILGTDSHIHLIGFYNIDKNDWKSTELEKKNYNYCDGIGTLVDGIVHWTAYDLSFNHSIEHLVTIVAYDLTNGMIGEISPPEAVNSMEFMVGSKHLLLGEVYGSLSTLLSIDDHFEVWAMREYGVKESWAKLMVLPYNYGLYHYEPQRFRDERELILDDPASVKSPIYSKNMYVESLVSTDIFKR